jgi:hypothetical protein
MNKIVLPSGVNVDERRADRSRRTWSGGAVAGRFQHVELARADVEVEGRMGSAHDHGAVRDQSGSPQRRSQAGSILLAA